jgi:thymidine kinase
MAGALSVICGPMFAGKTTRLLAAVDAWEAARGRAIIITPAWDRRYHAVGSDAHVITHDGVRRAAHAAADAGEAASLVSGAIDDPARAGAKLLVVIDEAHFFGAALAPAVRAWILAGAHVLVCGVELDHRGEPFEPFPTLLAEADEVVKLASRCARCGGPARHSQRMNASGDRIVVGGADLYEARCRNCFEPGV